MTEVALIGAGGNMGRRITQSLAADPKWSLRYVEPSPAGRERLAEIGVHDCVELDQAIRGAEAVILAVPDTIVGSVSTELVEQLDPGTVLVCLDPAAVHADRIPRRDDTGCFVVHPTHPPLYLLLDEDQRDARRDYWGGGIARQAIVCALAWGAEAAYGLGESLARAMFAPVQAAHRITVDQMALLEPGMSESVTNSCISVIRETLDRVIAKGVPEAAARDFMMGHLQLGIAILFGEIDWKLSAGAQLALEEARERIFRSDWYRLLDDDAIHESTAQITGGARTTTVV